MTERQLTADVFETLIGERFSIAFTDGTVPLTLRKVVRLPGFQAADPKIAASAIERGARPDPFTLLFGGVTHHIPQRTYALTSPAWGDAPLELFIVPVGKDADGFLYEAVFG